MNRVRADASWRAVETNLPIQSARKRGWWFAAILLVIGLGLASRKFPGLFPRALGKYPGDALWALMVFLGWGVIFPSRSVFIIFLLTLVTSSGVELLKLIHVPWLDQFRSTTAGHLILGSDFWWQNLVAYAIGATIGAAGECGWFSRARREDTGPTR